MSQRLQTLFDKYARGQATPEELQEFWELLAAMEDEEVLSPDLKAWWNKHEEGYDLSAGIDGSKTLKRILATENNKQTDYIRIHHKPVRRIRQLWAAAAVLLIMGFASWFYLYQPKSKQLPVAKISNSAYKNDVLPGVTGATLTLADGSIVQLDSVHNNLHLTQGNAQVSAANGTIVYAGRETAQQPAYNTLTTRKGQQYPVRLSDGSLVVLDAGSSITYPVVFQGAKRIVQIQGQAWFEIAKDSSKPFIVQHSDKQIQVYGTHFNVKAYEDESELRITLAEGSIKVTNGNISQMLIPGQQAILSKSGNAIRIDAHADIDETIAWKNGQFEYKSKDLTYVMRDLARWYDIEVVYDGLKPADTFTGGFSRSATLTELLTILEMSRIHFKLEGRKLTVLSRQ